jgi:hypothetical protein
LVGLYLFLLSGCTGKYNLKKMEKVVKRKVPGLFPVYPRFLPRGKNFSAFPEGGKGLSLASFARPQIARRERKPIFRGWVKGLFPLPSPGALREKNPWICSLRKDQVSNGPGNVRERNLLASANLRGKGSFLNAAYHRRKRSQPPNRVTWLAQIRYHFLHPALRLGR